MKYNIYLIIKPTRCSNFSNLFWTETLCVLDSSTAHHQFFTIHTVMVYVIQVCSQLPSWYCSKAVYVSQKLNTSKRMLYNIFLLRLIWNHPIHSLCITFISQHIYTFIYVRKYTRHITKNLFYVKWVPLHTFSLQ
jgi:hypothetical protein